MLIADFWYAFIELVRSRTGLPDQMLHVHAGMAVFVIAALATRETFASPLPLSMVFVVEAINELLDRLHSGSWRWADTVPDVIDTVFWPVTMFLVLRLSAFLSPRLPSHSER
jgi:hypothetical protein